MTTFKTNSFSWQKQGPLYLLLFCMALLAFGLLVHPLGDPDVYIHLRDGRYWVEKHLLVGQEPFAYTVPEKSIEHVEVLFRIGIYLAYQLGGYALLTVSKALAMTAALFFLGILIYRRWSNLAVVWVLLALAIIVPANPIMPERPYVVTYLLLPLLLLWLDDYRRADAKQMLQAGKKLWLLPLIVILWANLHPGFIVIFGFLGALGLDFLFNYWKNKESHYLTRFKHLVLVSSAAFLASAINPIGFSLYTFVLQTTGSQDFMQFLTEWAPPAFASEPLFFILLGLVGFLQLLAISRLRCFDFIPMAAFSYLAYNSYRNMPLFLIAVLPPLAEHLAFLWQRYFPTARFKLVWKKPALYAGSALTLLVLIWASWTGHAFRLGQLPGMYPEKGLAWLMDHPIRGRLLTHDIWGGYTGWMTQGQIQVFIDGRFPLFGEKLYADYRKIIWGDPQACLSLLDKYKIQGLLVSPKNDIKLFQRLWESRNWALVYWDDVCLVYVRKTADNEALIKPFQYFSVDPKRNPYFNPNKKEDALNETRRATEINPHSFLPWFFRGELALHLGHLPEARESLNEVLRRAPKHAAALYNLGIIAYEEKSYQEAENLLRRALKTQVPDTLKARICFMLGVTLKQSPARWLEAKSFAKQALVYQPDWKDAQQLFEELSRPSVPSRSPVGGTDNGF